MKLLQKFTRQDPNFNLVKYLKTNANFFKDQLDVLPGILTIGNDGIEFRANNGLGFIQISFREIKLIRMQKIFNLFYRGFFVTLKNGQVLNFVTGNSKKVKNTLKNMLPESKIRDYKPGENL